MGIMSTPTFIASLDAGRELFIKGEFHEAHEAWESGWRRTRGAERVLLQVLVLWSAALHHHSHGNLEGTKRLLLRALEKSAALEDELLYGGMDVENLREGLVSSLERAGLAWADEYKPTWPPIYTSIEESLEHEARCPYCGEHVLVSVAPEEADDAQYFEDCPVCCRPWTVQLSRDGDALRVTLGRDDAQ